MPGTPTKQQRVRTQLAQEIVGTVQDLHKGVGTRATLLRRLAELIVRLRGQYEFEGHTDWAGRGGEYREAIAGAYREAGVPQDTVDGLQAALRYHIGNVLREVAPPDELQAAGLDPEGPLERLHRRREAARQKRQGGKVEAALEAVEHGQAITFPLIPAGDKRRQPRIGLGALQDPIALVGLALDAVRAAADLDVRGETAEALQLMLRRLNDEVFDLAAVNRARAARAAKRRA